MKQEHTGRTCKEILELAEQLALDDRQKQIAEVVALFHDVGRFPQFAEYRTFNDAQSIDHSHLGVEILRREGVLDVLSGRNGNGWRRPSSITAESCCPPISTARRCCSPS